MWTYNFAYYSAIAASYSTTFVHVLFSQPRNVHHSLSHGMELLPVCQAVFRELELAVHLSVMKVLSLMVQGLVFVRGIPGLDQRLSVILICVNDWSPQLMELYYFLVTENMVLLVRFCVHLGTSWKDDPNNLVFY